MNKGQIRHPGTTRHQQAIQSNHIVWHWVEHVCQHLHFKHKYQLLCSVREMHLKIFKNQSAAYWEVETTRNHTSGRNDSQAFLSQLDPATLRSLQILMAVFSLPHLYLLHPGHLLLPLTSLRPCQKAWPGWTLCPCDTGSFCQTLSFGSCETHPCLPFPRKNPSSSDTWFLLISSPLCPLTALGPVPRQQPGLQKNIKCYRTKAQHSLICNAFCMKHPFSRVCHWEWKCSVSLRNLAILHPFLLHYSRLQVHFAFLRKRKEHKKHADPSHGLY